MENRAKDTPINKYVVLEISSVEPLGVSMNVVVLIQVQLARPCGLETESWREYAWSQVEHLAIGRAIVGVPC